MSEPVACVSTWPIREGQGEGRGFESRLPLSYSTGPARQACVERPPCRASSLHTGRISGAAAVR